MDRKEYLLRQIAKTNKKNYENYVVTGIVHRLADPQIKYVTQQYVRRPEGYALTDLYLPQLDYHVEVDEGFHQANVEQDKLREADIINATGHTIERVDAMMPLDQLDARIDQIVGQIRALVAAKRASDTFQVWDPQQEHSPETYIRQGYMDADDDVAFRRQAEACNCFGHNYAQWYRAQARHAFDPTLTIWFPKLYGNKDWHNRISADEETIYERRKWDNAAFIAEHLGRLAEYPRLVFARVRGPLGDVMYRFKGLYEVDVDESRRTMTVTYRRKATQVKTYGSELRK